MLTTHNIDIQAMLVWLILPFYDFCGFRSVAVNSVYKLQFFTFIIVSTVSLCYNSADVSIRVLVTFVNILATIKTLQGQLLEIYCA